MTKSQAVLAARRRAKVTQEDYFVVYEPDVIDRRTRCCYHLAKRQDIGAFYRPEQIIFSTRLGI